MLAVHAEPASEFNGDRMSFGNRVGNAIATDQAAAAGAAPDGAELLSTYTEHLHHT